MIVTVATTPLLLNELRQVSSRTKFGLDPDAVQLLMSDMDMIEGITVVTPGQFADLLKPE